MKSWTFFEDLIADFFDLPPEVVLALLLKHLLEELRQILAHIPCCFVNSCEGWCQPKVLTKFQEFNSGVATDLLLATLFQTPEQVQLVIAF